jgi:hypothetical protein
MSAWFAEIAIGIGASFAATLLVKATLTLAVALAVTGLARRSRAALDTSCSWRPLRCSWRCRLLRS